jgi:paraquat-inducible protein B
MAEEVDPGQLPRATIVAVKRSRISPVWVIPILAAVVAIGVAVQRLLNEGPSITIVFRSAEGIEAGKTFVKYKDVNIGQVTAVRLSENFSKVEVTAKITKSAEGLMVEDAKFWVVRPRITLSGISGLGTLLSGNYIGFEAGGATNRARKFNGLEVPPVITGGMVGRQFLLKSADLGSLGIGSPVYFRRLQVGQVVAYDLAADGKAVELKVFVNAPYDKYVRPGTRFWNASGIDVSLNANGLDVRTESLVALLAGGVAFDTPAYLGPSEPAAANTAYNLSSDRAAAMKRPESISMPFVLYFKEPLRGLSVGAPVTFFGLQVGEVTDVGLRLDPVTLEATARVDIDFFPERFIERLPSAQQPAAELVEHSPEKTHTLLQRLIDQRGLRAQLRSGNLLTGQLYVAFDYFPGAAKAKVDWSWEAPVLPVTASTLPDIENKLTSILAKLDRLPIEAIGQDLRQDLKSLDQTLKDARRVLNRVDAEIVPALKTSLEEARRTLAATERVMQNVDATLVGPNAAGQQELREALQEVARAARSLRALTDYLERHPEALIRGKTEQKGGRN